MGTDHPYVASNLKSEARLYLDRGDESLDPGLALVDRAMAILDGNTGEPRWRVEAFGVRSRLLKRAGDVKGALSALADSLKSVEQLRIQTGGGEETRAGYLERYSEEY